MAYYDINDASKDEIIANAKKNLKWIEKNSPMIRDFLRGYLNGGGRTELSWVIVVVGIAVNFCFNK
jgi:hypothetical protein